MQPITQDDQYQSPDRRVPIPARALPGLFFYLKTFSVIWKASHDVKADKYSRQEWFQSSYDIFRGMESVGGRAVIENLSVFQSMNSPGVFVGNHMSTLETMILPAIIQPFLDVTFIVKESLMQYPFFKDVLGSCDPIVVSRTDPRHDLKVVLDEGLERLKRNISVIVFPQRTRTRDLIKEQFNSIGVKLARNAGVPVIPMGLKTDFWANGKWIKDLGKIDPKKTVHIAFGKPLEIHGNGRHEHENVFDFITTKLKTWSQETAKRRQNRR